MKTITYDELIDRIRQKNPPKRITICVEGWTKDYVWDRKRDNYFDDWGDPLHDTYSLAELAIASIEIYEMTNGEKFKEVFGDDISNCCYTAIEGKWHEYHFPPDWLNATYEGDK